MCLSIFAPKCWMGCWSDRNLVLESIWLTAAVEVRTVIGNEFLNDLKGDRHAVLLFGFRKSRLKTY